MLSEFGFPFALVLILLWGFKKLGEVLLARVVDPVIHEPQTVSCEARGAARASGSTGE
jgi:hypothetical protein